VQKPTAHKIYLLAKKWIPLASGQALDNKGTKIKNNQQILSATRKISTRFCVSSKEVLNKRYREYVSTAKDTAEII